MNKYEKLAIEIFGEKDFNGIKDAAGFEKALTEVLETLEPAQKEAILAGGGDDYAKAMRNLKHPSRSGLLKEYLA